MGKHVAAEDGLTVSELVDLALAGGPVTITRGGKVVAELSTAPEPPQASPIPRRMTAGDIDWLENIARQGPHLDVDVAKLVREMRDEGF